MAERSGEAGSGAARAAVMAMWSGFALSRAVEVAADLAIADRLASPRTAESLAEEIGAHAGHLRRLLRFLASHGVFAEDASGRFDRTPLADVLRSDAPGSLHDVVRMYDRSIWDACAELGYAVRTGESPFVRAAGTTRSAFLAAHPEAQERHSAGVSALSARYEARVASAYDFSGVRTVVDVGGGDGGFLGEVLKRGPHLAGVLFDRPAVVASPRALRASGAEDRCRLEAGDFFESVPAGGDVYVLKRVLPGFDDEECVRILRSCRAAMPEAGRLLGVDGLLPPPNAPHSIWFSDVIMLLSSRGRERSEAEYRELYGRAAFNLERVLPTRSPWSILEGVPV